MISKFLLIFKCRKNNKVLTSNLAEIAKSCIYVFGIVIELFFFFYLPATYLMIEVLQHALFQNFKQHFSVWKNGQHHVQHPLEKFVFFTILSVRKMVKINLETRLNVFKNRNMTALCNLQNCRRSGWAFPSI